MEHLNFNFITYDFRRSICFAEDYLYFWRCIIVNIYRNLQFVICTKKLSFLDFVPHGTFRIIKISYLHNYFLE